VLGRCSIALFMLVSKSHLAALHWMQKTTVEAALSTPPDKHALTSAASVCCYF
jgi:hypothetical protein